MSGGHFDYKQFWITQIAEDIQVEINRSGREKTKEELRECHWIDEEYLKTYPEERYYYKYSDEVIQEFKNAVNLLEKAAIYAQRIDWLLSGDDGEKSFLERLKEELEELESKKDKT